MTAANRHRQTPRGAAAAWAALLLVTHAGAAPAAPDPRHAGFDDMGPALQAMQRDDSLNPALLAVQEGAALWRAPADAGHPSCADCHGDAERSMRGVAARYPAWPDAVAAIGTTAIGAAAANTAPAASPARPLNLAERINTCRQRHQHASALADDDPALLALSAYVGLQSRGLPLAPPADPRLAPWRARGAALWQRRFGQLNLSCAQCHDTLAGRRLGGAVIPQGHPTGYPLYRLEWQAVGSLQRRLRACMAGVRAEPFAAGADEWRALEVFLAARAAGLAVDTPALRP